MRALWLTLGLLLIPSVAEAQADSVWAFSVVPAGMVDSIVQRSQRDTSVTTIRNGPRMVLWGAPYLKTFRLRDSLRVWCTGRCQWEWDSVVPVDSLTDAGDGALALWMHALHGSDSACAMGSCGAGVSVGNADTGADKDHPEFAGRFWYGKNYGGHSGPGPAPDSTDFSDTIAGCNGHGTHVLSSMGGISTGGALAARLVAYRVMNSGNGGCLAYSSASTRALLDATRNGVDVMNISIAHNQSYAMGQALVARKNAGFVTCGSSGNDGSGPTLFWPAGDSSGVGAGAADAGGNRASFSRWGPALDFLGAGVGVWGAVPGGYAGKSGTSMGSPWTCATFAQVYSTAEFQAMPKTRVKVDSAQSLLCRTATRKPASGRDDYVGCGIPHAARAIADLRGGVWIAGDTLQVVEGVQEKCFPMVATRAFTVHATSGVAWRRDGDSVCLTLGPDTPRTIQVVVQ